MSGRKVLTTLALLLLAGCAASPVSGRVVEKRYIPERSWITYDPTYRDVCTSKRNSNGTTSKTCRRERNGTRPVYHHNPDCYRLVVADENEGRNRDVCTDPTTYNRLEVGSHYEEVQQ